MIGGLFAGLVAPFTFSWIAEYPILLALAMLCRPPRTSSGGIGNWLWLVIIVTVAVIIGLSYRGGAATAFFEDKRVWLAGLVAVLAALLAVGLKVDRWRLTLLVALGLVLTRVYPIDQGRTFTVRSFFGVHKIVVTQPARPVSRTDARHDDSRRREIHQRRRHAGDRTAGAHQLLS